MKLKSKRHPAALRWTLQDVTSDVLAEWCRGLEISPDPATLVHAPMPDPAGYTSEEFRVAYWQAETWSKYPFEMGIDRKEVALANFFEFEASCAATNQRLCEVMSRPVPERYRSWLASAQSLMSYLFEDFTLDEVLQHCKWGPGASTSMSRLIATPQNKWAKAAHISKPALPYKVAFERWCGREFSPALVVKGNRVVTVPKNAKTERTIAIEPDWNMFFQLGFGGAIRRRLQRKFGLLHKNAQEVNQALAKRGSEDGFLATVDLKGASDTVSLALVELLVPPNVYQHLINLRSPVGTLPDGREVTYEKISSMGNGFTFELETAIFYCLVRACSGYARAYGDDIICASGAVQQVLDFLSFCGFASNEKKTHSSGPFRESCGGHFHSGVNVTPPYVRKPLVGAARLVFCNRLSELCSNGHWREGRYKSTWEVCAQKIPRWLFGPVGVDGVLHVPFDAARPRRSKRYQSFTGTRLVESRRVGESCQYGGLMQSLWTHGPEVDWRLTGFEKKSSRPVLSYQSWVSGWRELAPWCSV
jgi:hypothetical protein